MINMKAVKGGAFTDYITASDVSLERISLTDYQGEEIDYLSLPELGIDAKSLTFWHGGFARALGLEGTPVEKAHSDALDSGRHPFTGAKLLQNAGRTSPDALGRTASGGVSFVFAPPKVDSLLFLAFPEYRLRIVRDIIEATKLTIDYFEDRAVLSRVGKAGREIVHATGAWACAVHFLARNGQVFLHVHAHLKQAVLCEDAAATTRSLHNTALFEQQRAAGNLFDSIRARQLQALGFDIRPAERAYRCEGVPDVLIDLLSQRRAEIIAKLDEWGTRSAHAAEIAAYQGRDDKTERTLSQTLNQHEAETRAIGWPVERIRESVLSHRLDQKHELTQERDTELLESVYRAAQKVPDETSDFSAYPDAPRALPLRAVEALTFQKALHFLGVPFSALVDVAARVFDRIKTEYKLDLDPYELRGAKVQSIRPYVERDTARLLEYDAPRAFARCLRGAPAAYSDELRGAGLLRTLDERDPVRRHELIEGIARGLKADGFRCVGITLRTADKESLASATDGLFPVFTAAKAAAEWDKARWRLGKRPDEGKFEAPRTDPIQDWLAQHVAGTMSRGHVKYNAWQRERAPLYLGDGHKHAIILDAAEALDARRLYGILFEARRHRALVIACGDGAGRPGWFSGLCERFAPAAPERAQQNYLDDLARRRALEPVPTFALSH